MEEWDKWIALIMAKMEKSSKADGCNVDPYAYGYLRSALASILAAKMPEELALRVETTKRFLER